MTTPRRRSAPLPLLALLLAALLPAVPAAADTAAIRGDYVEARTADVWTGPCFANGEVNLEGQEAILAWRVEEGAWDGVGLAGLSVAAVVTASATLGDPHAEPLPARALLLVDERGTAAQRAALAAFARREAGALLADVVAVEAAPIDFTVDGAHVELAAGGVAELRTRPLTHHDRHCGNEIVYYPPLTDVPGATPAATVVHAFRGDGLGRTWSSPGKRSAFVGTFAR